MSGLRGWDAHAVFMDALFDQRFAALVGPLEGTRDALLILAATQGGRGVSKALKFRWRAGIDVESDNVAYRRSDGLWSPGAVSGCC